MTNPDTDIAPPFNLDAMNRADLHRLASAFETMSRYCRTRAEAMAYRVRGEIEPALRLDAICDSLYEVLPPELQW